MSLRASSLGVLGGWGVGRREIFSPKKRQESLLAGYGGVGIVTGRKCQKDVKINQTLCRGGEGGGGKCQMIW